MNEFYTACGADAPDGGIYHCRIDASGAPEVLDFRPMRRAGYFALSPDRRTLYVVGIAPGLTTGGAAAFRIAGSGALELLNGVDAAPGGSCHLCVSPDGKFLYTANYHSGSFSEFPLAPDGSFAGPGRRFDHRGEGPCGDRQAGPHVHFTGIAPDGRWLCVADLGIDAVVTYPLTPEGIDFAAARRFPVDPGSGPRHLAFSRRGDRAWLVTEMGNTVLTLAYADGKFELLDRVSTLPGGNDPFSKAAAIRLDAEERVLFVSNRGRDGIVRFELEDGFPRRGAWCGSGGVFPRDILPLPDGRTLLAANEISGELAVLRLDPASGTLAPTGKSLRLPRPIGLAARP